MSQPSATHQPQPAPCPDLIAILPKALHTRSQANHLRVYLIRERNFPPEIFVSSLVLADQTPCWIIAQLPAPPTPQEPSHV